MTFQVDYGGRTELEKFDYQAESDENPLNAETGLTP